MGCGCGGASNVYKPAAAPGTPPPAVSGGPRPGWPAVWNGPKPKTAQK